MYDLMNCNDCRNYDVLLIPHCKISRALNLWKEFGDVPLEEDTDYIDMEWIR
jgi:hypothetical protein